MNTVALSSTSESELGFWKGRAGTRTLLLSGVAAALLYVTADVLAGLLLQGYSFLDQHISETGAVGASTRTLVTVLLSIHGLLVGAFGVGVRRTFGDNRRLRWVGNLLLAVAVITLLGVIFAPMSVRGSAPSLNGTMHVVYISINSLLILIAIGLSAFALKGGFRVYALTSLIVMFGFGAWAGTFAGDIEAGLPTPWAGAIERASVYTYLVWLVVFAISLVQRQHLTPVDTPAGGPMAQPSHPRPL